MTIRKLKIYREEAKDRLTSHWDWDCMTTQELETEILQQEQHSDKAHKKTESQSGIVEKLFAFFRMG